MSLPFLVPVHRLPIPSFESEWLAAALGLLCLLAVCVSQRRMPLALPAIALAPIALLVVVVLQMLAGLPAAAANALVVCGYLLFSGLLMVAGHNLVRERGMADLYRGLAWALLGGGLAGSVVGFAQIAGLTALAPALLYPAAPGPGVEGAYGNLAQQNHFATYTALALAASLFLLRQGRLPRWPACAAVLMLGAALALSGSRSSVLYLGCIGLAWLCTNGTRRLPWRAISLVVAGGAVLVAALWLAAHAGLLGPRFSRLGAYGDGAGPRAYLWQQAWRMFAAHPWLGVGVDRFAEALVTQLRPGEKMFGVDQYAHNLGLQLLAVGGIAALLALLVPLAAFLRRAGRAHAAPDAMLAWAVLAILLVHSMLEQPLYYAYFLAIAAFVAGTLEPTFWTGPARRARHAAGIAAGTAAGGLLALLVAASDYGHLADFYGAQAGDPTDAPHQALLFALHRDPMFRALTELMSPASFVAIDAPVAERLALNTHLFAYAPIAEVAFRQAALLAEAGQPDAARHQFAQAALAYPEQAAQYAERLAGLAQRDPASFGALAAYAQAPGQAGAHPAAP